MLDEYKDIIIKNFVRLMKECDVNALTNILVNKGVFSEREINSIFSSKDARQNKRIFFFNIQKKDQKAFPIFLDALKETNQYSLVDILYPLERKGCKLFCEGQDRSDIEDSSTNGVLAIHEHTDVSPLDVKVKIVNQLYDEFRNIGVKCYSSRSKKRGRILIINNYDYKDGVHKYRNGAEVDNTNLNSLFTQMGGWEIEHYNNKTKQEMKVLIKNFSQNKTNNQFDICFVIIMGHGGENLYKTIIYGIDGGFIFTDEIQNDFSNEKCMSFRRKPKVFLFQVCRGSQLDWTIRHTEIDSAVRNLNSDAVIVPNNVSRLMGINIRTFEDVLTGYPTLYGYQAHRDPYLGSWYIELVCKTFMEHSYDTPVDDMLQIVDNHMRNRMSETQSMQTTEYLNRGFRKLYLNPGIYYEDGIVKKYFD